jgi:hypothetical protein
VTGSNLKQHKLVHIREEELNLEFQCFVDRCKKQFSTIKKLSKHIYSLHKEIYLEKVKSQKVDLKKFRIREPLKLEAMGTFSSCSCKNGIFGESQNNNNDSKFYDQQQKLNISISSPPTARKNSSNNSINHHMKLRKRKFIEIDCEQEG